LTDGSHQGSEDAGTRRGGEFYDEPRVFERYRQRRQGVANPNFVMEEPALLEELGSVQDLRVVDLGCGDAALGRMLLEAGCARYVGIDGSENMAHAARATLRDTPGEVVREDIESFSAASGAFDLAVSRLALHYVKDIGRVLHACHACLVPAGRVVFTVLHPVITSHDARASTQVVRTNWLVDDYFVGGPREQDWLGGTVVWHHRTIEDYVTELRRAGFALTALRECPPRRERFADETEYVRCSRIPTFLLLAGTRA
jgi:SAM-dependent methyltransferase